jgi:AraC family transcriptional regulator, melibiose operon regulatory protein
MRRPDHHNEIELNFIESGSVTYLLGGDKITLQAGRLTAFWAAIPHQIIDFGEKTAYFVVTIPLPWFLQWRLPQHFSQGLMQGVVMTAPNSSGAETDRERFAQWEKDLVTNNEVLVKAVLLEMQARLVRFALDVPLSRPAGAKSSRSDRPVREALNRVERMACFIAQRYTDKLTVQDIAEHAQLHPNYAMNLFQRTFGTTLINYLTQHRVSHAQRLLATSDDSIADIAFSSGFNSISRFNDAFRRVCGCSPRDYRRTHTSPHE